MSVRMTRDRAARLGGTLFVLSGSLTLVNNQMPAAEALDLVLLNSIGLAAVLTGLACWYLIPWHRLPARATLVIPVLALGLVGIAVSVGGVTGQTFSAYFILIAAYIGATQPRLTMVWFSPLFTAVYVWAALNRTDSTSAQVWSVTVVVPVCVLVGEVLSSALGDASRLRSQSERRAELLGIAARSARNVSALETDAVLRAVADAALELGYGSVDVEVFDKAEATYRCVESRGLPATFTDSVHTSDSGITGEVRSLKRQVVWEDYSNHPKALPRIAEIGLKVVIGTPIWAGTHMRAVLNVGSKEAVKVEPAELEALVLLADQAGHALDLAAMFERERQEAQRYRKESMVDPLSGIGSRRHADEIISTARAGDAFALIDLDDFKRVNDNMGHAAGDLVVAALGGFLRTKLRGGDEAARYGGDEFVIALRRPGVELVEAVERLRRGWKLTEPSATFSVGTAIVRRDEAPTAAMDRADAALRRAKAQGKDQAIHADLGPEAPAERSDQV